MDVILISPRRAETPKQPTPVAELASTLAGLGHAVRWLAPQEDGESRPGPGGEVAFLPVTTAAPPFGSVQARLADLPVETSLAREIRGRLPDIVHVAGFGGVSSALLPWIADRLGVPSIVVPRMGELLCHRGTLIDETGSPCRSWDRPERCLACCLTPFAGGLGRVKAALARILSRLPALSPYPKLVDFINRKDLILGGLMPAARVLVADEEEHEILLRLGLPERKVSVTDGSTRALLEIYEAVRVV